MHSFDQILLGWTYGSIFIILFFNLYKKLIHRLLKQEANVKKDKESIRHKTIFITTFFLLLNLLNFIVYVYLENNYKLDSSYLVRIKDACENITDNFNPYDKSFVQSGIIAFIFGLCLCIIQTEGQYNKASYSRNFYSLCFSTRLKRLFLLFSAMLVISLPFVFLKFENSVF